MFASAKGKQQKQARRVQLECQEQCIDRDPRYLSGLSRAHFFRQPFSKQLYMVNVPMQDVALISKLNETRVLHIWPPKKCGCDNQIHNSLALAIVTILFKSILLKNMRQKTALNKVLYWGVPPEVQRLALLNTILVHRKGTPHDSLLTNGTPFKYLVQNSASLPRHINMNKSINQEVSSSFLHRNDTFTYPFMYFNFCLTSEIPIL